MGVMIPIKDWDVLCVLKDANNHGIEVAVDRRSGSIRLTGYKGFEVELTPARAMWIANSIIKYCPMFARKVIPDTLYSLVKRIK
jgi:hypothetical protein